MGELRTRDMTVGEFADYRARLVHQYAAENVEAGHWNPDGAEARSAAEIDALLPDGVSTSGMLLWVAETKRSAIGFAWVALDHPQRRGAWLYDIWLTPEQRGRGFGRALLALVEAEVSRRGGESLGLNVFGANHVARALYASSAYEVTSIQMRKPLTSPGV